MLVVHQVQSRALTIPRQCLLPLLDRDPNAANSQLGLFPVSFPLIDTPGNCRPFLTSQVFAEAPLLELWFIFALKSCFSISFMTCCVCKFRTRNRSRILSFWASHGFPSWQMCVSQTEMFRENSREVKGKVCRPKVVCPEERCLDVGFSSEEL